MSLMFHPSAFPSRPSRQKGAPAPTRASPLRIRSAHHHLCITPHATSLHVHGGGDGGGSQRTAQPGSAHNTLQSTCAAPSHGGREVQPHHAAARLLEDIGQRPGQSRGDWRRCACGLQPAELRSALRPDEAGARNAASVERVHSHYQRRHGGARAGWDPRQDGGHRMGQQVQLRPHQTVLCAAFMSCGYCPLHARSGRAPWPRAFGRSTVAHAHRAAQQLGSAPVPATSPTSRLAKTTPTLRVAR